MTNGAPRPPFLDELERDNPFLSNAIAAFATGEVFDRTVLDLRTRQIAVATAFAAIGLYDFFKVHAGYALNHGATEAEIRELANILIVPAGFPCAIATTRATSELLKSRAAAGLGQAK